MAQNLDVDVVEMKPPTRLHQIFEVDDIEMKPPTSKFEVAVRVRGIDRNGKPYAVISCEHTHQMYNLAFIKFLCCGGG